MNEVCSGSTIKISDRVLMDFYNRVKNIEALYPYLRLIQDKIDEVGKRFLCTITVTEKLSIPQKEAFSGII
jgi:hypothetical protein